MKKNIQSPVETINVTIMYKVYLNMISMHNNVLIQKDQIFCIFCNSVQFSLLKTKQNPWLHHASRSILSGTFCICFSYFIMDCPSVLHLEYPVYASVILSKIALSVLQLSLTSFHYYIQKFQSPIFHYAISAMFLQLSMQALFWNVPLNQDLYIHPDQPTAPT